MEVLRLLMKGLTKREIADKLGLDHEAVATHISEILSKIGLMSRNPGPEAA